MSNSDPLFREIDDAVARKRALADSANREIQQIIDMNGVPLDELLNKLNYLKRVLQEIKDL
jgi:hypothetical protein